MRTGRGVTASAAKVGLLLVGIVLVALAGVSAHGQSTSLTFGGPQFPLVYDWRQTAILEHQDRKNRFERLAAQGLIATPEFYDTLISKADLPQFGVDLPVLRIVFPQHVFFDTDKSEIRPDAIPIIDLVAQNLRHDVPDVAVFIAGRTDTRGSDEYNKAHSVERADVVARALFARGIGASRLWWIGFGKGVPIKPISTAENMAQNRRVEFLFAARAEAIAVWLSKQAVSTCSEVNDPMGPQHCRRRIAALPPFVAAPVLNEHSTTVVTGEIPASTRATEARETTLIGKNSRIVIDLNEQRVTVGSPVL